MIWWFNLNLWVQCSALLIIGAWCKLWFLFVKNLFKSWNENHKILKTVLIWMLYFVCTLYTHNHYAFIMYISERESKKKKSNAHIRWAMNAQLTWPQKVHAFKILVVKLFNVSYFFFINLLNLINEFWDIKDERKTMSIWCTL